MLSYFVFGHMDPLVKIATESKKIYKNFFRSLRIVEFIISGKEILS